MAEKTIYKRTGLPDPPLKMRVVRVMFEESRYNFQTNINGTRLEIADYYRGSRLNVANFPDEVMRTPMRLEFIGYDDYETIIVSLN